MPTEPESATSISVAESVDPPGIPMAGRSDRSVSRTSRIVLWVLMACGVAVIALGITLVLVVRHQMLEKGVYFSEHDIYVDGSTVRAFKETQKTHPNSHLIVDAYYPSASNRMYPNIKLGTAYDPDDQVRIETRGVVLVIKKHVYRTTRVHNPVIKHDGGEDPTTGYRLVLRTE